MHVDRIDHLVLVVRDIAATCAFYTRVLGMQERTFGPESRKALVFGRQKINLHARDGAGSPRARRFVAGAVDLCLVTSIPIAEVVAHLRDCEVPVELGPVARVGAGGPLMSVYIRDPDGNLIEVANHA